MIDGMRSLEIIHSPALDMGIPVFFRRPRSKKRRIIEKWKKRPENWRYEKCGDGYIVGKSNILVVSSAMLHEIRKLKPSEGGINGQGYY